MARFLMILAGLFSFASAAQAGSICISGDYLVSGETRQISVFDRNAHRNLGIFSMEGGQQTLVDGLMVNSAGYIEITYRNITNNGLPTNVSFLHDGDCIKP